MVNVPNKNYQHILFCLPYFLFFSMIGVIVFPMDVKGQDGSKMKRNTTYVEALGSGGWFSLNHEYMVAEKSRLALRAGVGYWSEGYGGYLVLPVSFHKLFQLKSKDRFLDVGLGSQWGFKDGKVFGDKPEKVFWNLLPQVGYRMHINEKIMFRISGMVGFGDGLFPFIGLSVGRRY